ncbi:MAG: hypothetical protein R2708_25360 [Vicinamibacterales bacterium]
MFSASTLSYQPPVVEESSALFLSRAAAAAEDDPGEATAPRPPATPDIVVWLQESTMDLGLLDVPGAALPPLDVCLSPTTGRASSAGCACTRGAAAPG